MPLVKRAVEPVFISRTPLDPSVSNELEGVSLNTFAGIVRQLSNLSWQAENLFGELFKEADVINQRANSLKNKISSIKDAVVRLDPIVERVSVEDIVNANHFKSSQESSQQILHRCTLPIAVQEIYQSCSQPPSLNKFTQYRDDGKEGLKFYTDSDYFVRLWVEETTKQTEKRRRKGVRKNRGRKSSRPEKQIQRAQRKQYDSRGKEFQEQPAVGQMKYSTPPTVLHSSPASPSVVSETRPTGPAPTPDNQQALPHPSAPPPPPPPPAPGISNAGAPQQNIPPPPPPPPTGFVVPPTSQGIIPNGPTQAVGYPPTAPPAMAPPAPPAPPPVIQLPSMVPAPPPPPGAPQPPPPPGPPPAPGLQALPPVAPVITKTPEPDPRSDLLSAIRLGKQLRKVDRTNVEVKKTEAVGGFDVASILARRIAVEMSESESDDDDTDDSDDWE